MKLVRLALLLALVVSVVGCSPANSDTGPRPQTLSNDPIRKPAQIKTVNWEKLEVNQVTLSRSQRFGKVNPAVLGTFTQREDIARFTEALRKAEKIDGKLDVVRPEYDLTLTTVDDEHEHSFHLWIGASKGTKGMYTYVADTGTGYTLSEEDTDRLREMIGELPYTSEQAESNGDIVNMHGKIINSAQWTRFIEQVDLGTESEVHITSYTIEGDPIFQDLLFDGQAIRYTYDNTMDRFGSPLRATAFCKNIEQNEGEFTLSKCDGDVPEFSFVPDSER